MIHWVDNFSVKGITINGIDTATFTEDQTAYCGVKLKVTSRKEFRTRASGWYGVDCPDCIKKQEEWNNRPPLACNKCNTILSWDDKLAMRPLDFEYWCIKCRPEEPKQEKVTIIKLNKL